MTIQVLTRMPPGSSDIIQFDHVLDVSVSGSDGFLNIGYTDPVDSRRHDKNYASGQWISFHFTALTVGGY